MYLSRKAIHTATGEASRVYSISVNTTTDGCYLRGRGASCLVRSHFNRLLLISCVRLRRLDKPSNARLISAFLSFFCFVHEGLHFDQCCISEYDIY